jgi:ribosome-associated translation inhibitor RaiA
MNIKLRYSGLNPRSSWRALAETHLNKLQGLAASASAQTTLEWQRESKPAFRVQVQLEVPGPDYHAEARDHTLQAALIKVAKNLERQIRLRMHQRADRRNTNIQLGFLPGH